MKTRRSYALMGRVGVALAFLLVLAFGLLLAGPEGASAGEAASAQPAGPVEGIEVHGHWTIEVRDPDGTLVERREFDNALASNGERFLTQLLARSQSLGNWQVRASCPVSAVCVDMDSDPISECLIVEAGDPMATQPYFFETLSVSAAGDPGPYSLTLSGNLTAQLDGSITAVDTIVLYCGSATAPDDCVGAGVPPREGMSIVTGTVLPSPVAVLTGQQVLVTVVITFS
jgi:hypothetical protein